MPTSFQKPSGIAYITPHDVSQTNSESRSSQAPEFWTAERIRTTELDAIQCLKVAATVAALSEAPPFAAFAAVLGGHQCFVNLFADFTASEKDSATFHQLSNLFDPFGLQLGLIGGLFGSQGLIVGAELGGLLSGGRDLAEGFGLSTAADSVQMIKLGEDFSTMIEDAKKLSEEFERRFGSSSQDESGSGQDEEDSQAPDAPPDSPPPSPDENQDDDNGDFEMPEPMPNGDDDFFMG